MTDSITKSRRSWNMSRIRNKDTKPEKIVRSILHRIGFRFRLHQDDLPGKPDIVLPKYKTVVFVHGCFWHRHEGCPDATTPKTRTSFWENKFNNNIQRDKRTTQILLELGWNVVLVWECEIKKNLDDLENRLKREIIIANHNADEDESQY